MKKFIRAIELKYSLIVSSIAVSISVSYIEFFRYLTINCASDYRIQPEVVLSLYFVNLITLVVFLSCLAIFLLKLIIGKKLAKNAVRVGLLIIIFWIFYGISSMLLNKLRLYIDSTAKEKILNTAVIIEDYRASHGMFPNSLSDIGIQNDYIFLNVDFFKLKYFPPQTLEKNSENSGAELKILTNRKFLFSKDDPSNFRNNLNQAYPLKYVCGY